MKTTPNLKFRFTLLKHSLFILLLTLVIYSTQAQQNQIVCFGIDTQEVVTSGTRSSHMGIFDPDHHDVSNCPNSNNLLPNIDRYKLQENFIPVSSDPNKIIPIRLGIIQYDDGSGNFQNTQPHINFLQDVISRVNNLFANIAPPEAPQTCVCGTDCHIQDTKFRVSLEGINFYENTGLYLNNDFTQHLNAGHTINEENEINIILLGDDGSSPGGAITNFSYANLNVLHGIWTKNYFPIYEEWLDSGNVDWGATLLANNIHHEIGHNLNLNHTYENTCCAEKTSTGNIDYLNDFWGDGTTSCPQIPMPFPNWCDTIDPATCSRNWMGARQAQHTREATPMQVGRAHRSTMLSSMRNYVKIGSTPYANHEITQNETWDFDIRMYGNIVVKNNATLIIDCRVFTPSSIIVEDGGELIINGTVYFGNGIIIEKGGSFTLDGGLLTNHSQAGLGTWQGIEVMGDHNQPASFAHQGYVNIKNNATVENANTALKVHGGGIVRASNSTFKNNRTTGLFLNTGITVNTGTGVHRSWFRDNTFEITEDFDFGTILKPRFFYVDNRNDALRFTGNHFIDKRSFQDIDVEERYAGIVGKSANINVTYNCGLSMSPGCSEQNKNKNIFEDLRKGVDLSNTGIQLNTVRITDNEFINCWRAIEIKSVDYAEVLKNNILLSEEPYAPLIKPPSSSQDPIGISIFEVSGFRVEENTIEGISNEGVGIAIQNTGKNANEVYKNNIENVKNGIQIREVNRSTYDQILGYNPEIGLTITCNTFLNVDDINILLNKANMARYQGSVNNPAGNNFTQTCVGSSYDLYSTSGAPGSAYYDYYYGSGTKEQPMCVANYSNWGTFNLIQSTTDNECSSLIQDLADFEPQDALSEMRISEEDFIELGGLVDGGNTSGLMNDLDGSGYSASEKLGMLTESTPYLSDYIISFLITNLYSEYSSEEMANLIISNSPLTPTLLPLLDEIEYFFTEDDWNDVQSVQSEEHSPRDSLYAEMTRHAKDYSRNKTSFIVSTVFDTTNDNRYQDILTEINPTEGVYLDNNLLLDKILLNYALGYDIDAQSLIDTTTGWYELDSLERQVFTLLDEYYSEGSYPVDTSTAYLPSDSLLVAPIAFDSALKTNKYALTLLENISDFEFEIHLLNQPEIPAGKNEIWSSVEEETAKTAQQSIFIYPNPSSGIFIIQNKSNRDKAKINSIEVYDLNGTVIFNSTFNQNQVVEINLNQYAAGIYHCRLKLDSGKVITQKLIKK